MGRGDNGMPHWVAWAVQNPKMERHLGFGLLQCHGSLSCGIQLVVVHSYGFMCYYTNIVDFVWKLLNC